MTKQKIGLVLFWIGAIWAILWGVTGSVPKVVEKGIGMSYPIGKPNKKMGGYADEERIPQGAGIDHVRAGVIAGRAYRPTTGAVRSGRGQASINRSPGGRGD